jgi:hypothetical protein
MGFAAGLFDESPAEEVKFWRAWNGMPRRERRKFLKELGREKGKLLNNRGARQELAKFVRENVFQTLTDRGTRGTRGKRRR